MIRHWKVESFLLTVVKNHNYPAVATNSIFYNFNEKWAKIHSCDVTLGHVTKFQKEWSKVVSLFMSYLCQDMKLFSKKFSWSRSFQRKLSFLVYVIPFNWSHSFEWKPFLLVEVIPFTVSYFFYWKLLHLVENILLSARHFFWWKCFLFVEAIQLLEVIPFSGRF